jgi:hypothetical protein
MLIGILPKSLIQRQQAFYNGIRSRKNATRWAMLLILQSWTLIRNMWLGRCAALHRKHIINSMIGSHLLDLEIEKEYDAGFHNLPVGIQVGERITRHCRFRHLYKLQDTAKVDWIQKLIYIQEKRNI